MLERLLKWVKRLAADRGYDEDWVRNDAKVKELLSVFLRGRIVKSLLITTSSFTKSATKLSGLLVE